MEVKGPGSIQRTMPLAPAKAPASAAGSPAGAAAGPKDAVDISAAGKMLDKLSKAPEVRAARLAQIKAAIDAGGYDTDEKLEAALMSLFQSMVDNERRD